MTSMQTAHFSGQRYDVEVCRALDAITTRLLAEPGANLDSLINEYPEHAEQLRHLLPAMHAMAEVGRLSGAGSAPTGDSQVVVPDAEAHHAALAHGVLGDFRLIRELGRGGMGVVYEAEQISLGRRVALKVLPFAAILDERQLVRFKNEARAAATLHHTNIVPVFSVGCERGVHFYAMQFIEGHTLADVIAQLRKESGGRSQEKGIVSHLPDDATTDFVAPSSSPAADSHLLISAPAETLDDAAATIVSERSTNSPAYYRTIARLGIQAAEALEHAHQHGVMHRDIKPANLLLDAAGNLWITDFGLARLETDAGMTMTGDLIGTLRYMSPEQALGKRVLVDYRADIYSLGVTLYELLALTPPFGGEDRATLIKQISFNEPHRLRSRNRSVPSELETIVHKAIEKNPDDRYTSAQALADDLRHFLENRPIKARPATVLTRVRKFARRHQYSLAWVFFLFTVIIAGAGIAAAMLYFQSDRFLHQQRIQAEAERNSYDALGLVDQGLRLAQRGELDASDVAFRKAIVALERIDRRFENDLEFRTCVIIARLFHAIVLVDTNRNDLAEAEFRVIQSKLAEVDLAGETRRTLWTFHRLGAAFYRVGDRCAASAPQTAVWYFERGSECFRRVEPNHLDAQARCWIERAQCLQRTDRAIEARQSYLNAAALLEACLMPSSDLGEFGSRQGTSFPDMLMPNGDPDEGVCRLLLAFVRHELGERDKARLEYDAARAAVWRTSNPSDEVIGLLQKTARLVGRDPDPYDSVVQALRKSGLGLIPSQHMMTALIASLRPEIGPANKDAIHSFNEAVYGALIEGIDLPDDPAFNAAVEKLGDRAVRRVEAHRALLSQEFAEAEALCHSLLASDADSDQLRFLHAVILEKSATQLFMQGDGTRARESLDRAISVLSDGLIDRRQGNRLAAQLSLLLATTPIEDRRDYPYALTLALISLQKTAASFTGREALAVAQYRLGQWQQSAENFEQWFYKGNTDYGHVVYRPTAFLAAASHWKAGNRKRAAEIFEATIKAMRSRFVGDESVLRFRREAEEVMGITPENSGPPAPRAPEPTA